MGGEERRGKKGGLKYVQWCRITKGLSKITSDFVLGGEIDLLEQFGRDGYAASSLDSLQCSLRVHVVV